MKTPTIVLIIVVVLVILGGWYWWSMSNVSAPAPQAPVTETGNGHPMAQAGEHCGGNMMNAPVCGAGFHCAANPGSHLPVGDVGGTCVADNAAMYIDGNLLLGTDGAASAKHLIGYNGMTLYTFNKDTATVSACTGACATNWPPYVVPSAEVLANVQAGIAGKVTSITRADGAMQVVYNGHPLYFWIQDKKSGDATGDGINGFSIAKP